MPRLHSTEDEEAHEQLEQVSIDFNAQGAIAVGPKARLVGGDCVADAAESAGTAGIATQQIAAGVAFGQGPAERRDHYDHRGISDILTRDLLQHWIPERIHGWLLRIPVPDEAA